MTELIVMLSTGKGTWAQVYSLIKSQDWEKIIIVTNLFGKEKFNNEKNAELIVVDLDKDALEISASLKKLLKPKISGIEIAVNFVSGDGKEHMALISALFSIGVAIRLVGIDKNNKMVEY